MFGKKKKDEDTAKPADGAKADQAPAADAPNKKDDSASGGGGVSNMRSGDYMIHVFLEKVKEINVKEGETVDPMFVIESLG